MKMDSSLSEWIYCEFLWNILIVYMLNLMAKSCKNSSVLCLCALFVRSFQHSIWAGELEANSGRAHFSSPLAKRASPSRGKMERAKWRLGPSPARAGSCPGLPTNHTQPVQVLNHKLCCTAKSLHAWSKGLFSDAKLQLIMALDVILQLDIAQDFRTLTTAERNLRADLEKRVMGLAVLERSRKRQASRITYLREGDTNTKLFHLRVNPRRRKNHIQRLKCGNGWASSHEAKELLVSDHFANILGRPLDFNWAAINHTPDDLDDLALPFLELEIMTTIADMPLDKAPV
jgi:hypothetical protein